VPVKQAEELPIHVCWLANIMEWTHDLLCYIITAKIQMDTTLSVSDVDKNRFPQQGAYYVSDNFDTAQNRIYLIIDCDVGRVQVR